MIRRRVVLRAINEEEVAKLRLYSDPEAAPLMEAAAAFYGVEKDMVMAGNGSDEVLAFLFMAFQQESGKFYFPEISYSFYPVYCSVFGAETVKVPLKEDFPSIRRIITAWTGLLSSPILMRQRAEQCRWQISKGFCSTIRSSWWSSMKPM